MCNSANKRRDAINCEPDYPAIRISNGLIEYAGKLGADIDVVLNNNEVNI